MKIDIFGEGSTLKAVVKHRKELQDYPAGKLIDRVCFTDVPLTNYEKEVLYCLFVKEIMKNRLQRFIDLNFVLLVVGLLLACSSIVVLVTGYDGNLVLFYMSGIANLCLCTCTLSKSFSKLKSWLIRDSKENKSE